MPTKPPHLQPEYGAQFQDHAIATQYRKRPPYVAQTFDLISARLPCPAPVDGYRILDVGSGTGEIAIPLAELHGTIDAVEPSAAMLDIARQTPGAEKVRWHQSQAEAFDFPDDYHLIICAQCLAWLDWETVLPRFAQALTPEGWLLIVSQDALEDLAWMPALKTLIARYSTNQDFQPFNLLETLKGRGLFRCHGRAVTGVETFRQSIDDYVDSIHARNGFSRDRMKPSAAREFDDQVRSLLFRHHPDGIIEGPNQSVIVWGRPV